jgi:stage V sporulation protein G
MEITEVRIKLMEDSGERLQAFCSITFDHCFVIRDLKIIGGANGSFVAMPSRRLTAHCHQCGSKNHLKAGYCNQCGARLRQDNIREDDGRAKLYADIAHPINQACRDMIQQKVIEAYQLEQERAKLPGYVSSYDDFDEDIAPPPRRRSHGEHGHGRQESHIRKTPPVAPPHSPPPAAAQAPPTSTPTPSSAESRKEEVPPSDVPPPHVGPPGHTSMHKGSDAQKRGFGEGIL